jgi:hypothetical protein
MGLLTRLLGSGTRDRLLLDDLVADYRAEAAQAAHLRRHAEQARYPQVASQLRALADIEERHAGWLRDHILGLGGGIPPVAPEPLPGHNQWERAVVARKAAQEKRRRLIEHATHWDPEEPAAAKLLARLYDEDGASLAAYDDVVVRSDPHALD